MLGETDLEFFGYYAVTLATGDIVELPMFMGKVILDGYESGMFHPLRFAAWYGVSFRGRLDIMLRF